MEILSFPHLQNSYKKVIKNCIFCQFGNARQVYRHPSIWQEVSTYHGVNIRIQFSAVFISKVSLIYVIIITKYQENVDDTYLFLLFRQLQLLYPEIKVRAFYARSKLQYTVGPSYESTESVDSVRFFCEKIQNRKTSSLEKTDPE